MTTKTIEIKCSFCNSSFKRDEHREEKRPLQFCAYCGARLHVDMTQVAVDPKTVFLQEHLPQPPNDSIIGTIGHFLLLKSIGKGGMGEVFLAFDSLSGRRVALKRIRPDLVASTQLKERFIREARITSQLIHPSIIPIYSVHIDGDSIYYTMPYVAGQTLKQILADASERDQDLHANHDHKAAIPSLVRIFLGVLQAVAYAHSKNVLHRDIKPENIIIGTYGQVIILDWGLTKLIEESEEQLREDVLKEEGIEEETIRKLTRLGKPVGTVPYLAPERAQGKPASKQTDIYALGVILYQMLTLKLPFSRKNMKSFIENWQLEQYVPPEIRAPYRDVPQALSEIVKNSLSPSPEERYQSCDELIVHIESYLEGRSEWFLARSLKVNEKTDWEFQENVLLAEHTAISFSTEMADWYSMMISKESFSENVRLDVSIKIGPYCRGVGVILCIPDATQRKHLTDGYWLWLGSGRENSRRTTLFRSSVAVLEAPDIILYPNTTYHVQLHKVEQTISLTINGIEQFVHTSHIPVVGTHVGVLSQDTDFEVENYSVFMGSQNILVNCLAVPDAFLVSQEFDRALAEYRRIGTSFSGRAEGRESLFRAGVTLLEQGKLVFEPKEKEVLFDRARLEFQKLRSTPGAPLEYLGKALVYQTTSEFEEEVKCFELAFRRYKRHPLLKVLIEQVVLRMHETSRQNRVAAYHFISLVLRFLPEVMLKHSSKKLFDSLFRHWEIPPFFFSKSTESDERLQRYRFCLGISFWLEKPYITSELFEELITTPVLPVTLLVDCLFLFALWGEEDLLKSCFDRWKAALSCDEHDKYKHLFEGLSLLSIEPSPLLEKSLATWIDKCEPQTLEAHLLLVLMEMALKRGHYETVMKLYEIKGTAPWDQSLEEDLASRYIEAAFWTKNITLIEEIFTRFPEEKLSNERCPLFFMYGCFLAAKKGHYAAIRHFELTLDTPYPRTWLLGAHILTGKIAIRPKGWFQRSFKYERHILVRELRLYSYIVGDDTYAPGIEFLSRTER